MFFLGLLGLLQVWFIPGILFLSFSKRLKFTDMVILSVPLSITINCMIVALLVYFKLYYQEYFLGILVLEFIIITYNLIKNENINSLLSEIEDFLKLKKRFNFNLDVIDIPILLCLGLIVFLGLQTIGDVIHIGDALRSFNYWSLKWVNGTPIHTGFYPPGLPILMSIIYKIINNTDIEFFTRAIILIYPAWVFLIFYRSINLIKIYKNEIKLTLLISSLIFIYIFRNYSMYVGYTEPIQFLLTSVSIFLMALIFFKKKLDNYEYFLFGLIIIANPLIKQTGLYICFMFPIFYLILSYKKVRAKELFKNFVVILVPILIPFLWFIYTLYVIYIDKSSSSNMEFIVGLNTQSITDKLYYIFGFLTLPLIILIIFSLLNYLSLKIFVFITLPYVILYLLYIGYDNRHFALIVPIVAINIAMGINKFFEKFNLNRINYPKYSFSLISVFCVALFLVTINFYRGEERLLNSSISQKKLRGDQHVNILLYHYVENDELKIISTPDHLDFSFLPEIGNRINSNSKCSDFNIEEKQYYLLIKKSYCEKIDKKYLKKINKENYTKLFYLNDYYLFKKNNKVN